MNQDKPDPLFRAKPAWEIDKNAIKFVTTTLEINGRWMALDRLKIILSAHAAALVEIERLRKFINLEAEALRDTHTIAEKLRQYLPHCDKQYMTNYEKDLVEWVEQILSKQPPAAKPSKSADLYTLVWEVDRICNSPEYSPTPMLFSRVVDAAAHIQRAIDAAVSEATTLTQS